MREKLLALIAFLFYSALKLTWRIRVHEPESFKQALKSGEPLVYAFYHGDELGIVHLLKRYRAAAMVSSSKDGEIMTQVIQLFGSKVSRGSSTRGGASALKGILRLSKEGWRPAVAVDGPKGPYHKAKPGVFEVSRILGAPIYPITATADRAFVFHKSWNKAFLPKPFAKVQVVWGEAMPAITREQDARAEDLALRLEAKLDSINNEARELLGLSTGLANSPRNS